MMYLILKSLLYGLSYLSPFFLSQRGPKRPHYSKRKINQCIEKASDLCYPFFISLRL